MQPIYTPMLIGDISISTHCDIQNDFSHYHPYFLFIFYGDMGKSIE